MRNAKEQKASEGAKEGDTESDAALKEAAQHDKRVSSVRFLYINTCFVKLIPTMLLLWPLKPMMMQLLSTWRVSLILYILSAIDQSFLKLFSPSFFFIFYFYIYIFIFICWMHQIQEEEKEEPNKQTALIITG